MNTGAAEIGRTGGRRDHSVQQSGSATGVYVPLASFQRVLEPTMS